MRSRLSGPCHRIPFKALLLSGILMLWTQGIMAAHGPEQALRSPQAREAAGAVAQQTTCPPGTRPVTRCTGSGKCTTVCR